MGNNKRLQENLIDYHPNITRADRDKTIAVLPQEQHKHKILLIKNNFTGIHKNPIEQFQRENIYSLNKKWKLVIRAIGYYDAISVTDETTRVFL